jgi:hypothetical protein
VSARRRAASTALLAAGGLAALTGLIIVVSGGGRPTVLGVHVSLTSAARPFLIAAACSIGGVLCWPSGVRNGLRRAGALPRTHPRALAAALSCIVFAAGSYWGCMVAGGSDASGYVSQARLWRQGAVIVPQPIVARSPWPIAADTWAPLGYRPAARDRNAVVPTYSPGLPLLMAMAQALVGFCGAFLIAPVSGAIVVWTTYLLGRRLFESAGVALWGALLVATSPAFLFMVMNPMSDVPVTAAWTLALVLTVWPRPFLAGLAAAAAIAIRPNLVPIALVLIAWTARQDRRAAVRLAFGMLPAVVGIAWLNAHLYGSPFMSGYGSAGELYHLTNGVTNLRRYASWLFSTQTPVVALAAIFFVAPAIAGTTRVAHPRLLLGGVAGAVVLSYLFYTPFDTWWYLRFLLPMWPVLMMLTAAVLVGILRRWTAAAYPVAAVVCVAFFAWHGVRTAAEHGVFELWQEDHRYVDVAGFVSARTEPRAVFLSMQHSGSLRLYTGRLTLRYDILDPAWLDRAVAYLTSIDRHPYIVLDMWEVDVFRRRFASASRLGALDRVPIGSIRGETVVYDAADPRRMMIPVVIPFTGGSLWHCFRPTFR